MKLVEILARELEEWPSKECVCIAQDKNLDVYGWSDKPVFDKREWLVTDTAAVTDRVDEKPFPLATDHATAIVTRADWEAERAKLKAPKAKQSAPVSEEEIQVGIDAADAGKLTPIAEVKARWKGKKPSPKLERALKQAEEIRIAAMPQDTILAIRDRIRALDTQRAEVESTYQRQISEITQERESLVKRLAGEGLALVEVVVQPLEDMSDWAKWREGDIVEFIKVDGDTSCFTLGKHYVVADVNMRSINPVSVKKDDDGDYNGWKGEYFKFVSRPAS